MTDPVEIGVPGLWRWTAPHPRWRPEMSGRGGWEQDVASIACELEDVLVVIDPLLPHADDGILKFLDSKAARRDVAVFLTAPWHERSAQAIRDRYNAAVWASAKGIARIRCEVTHPIGKAGEPLQGLVAVPLRVPDEGEIACYLTRYKALVVAEVFIGTDSGLRVCMSPAVKSAAEWRDSLSELLELDVEFVLPAHGDPTLTHGHDAIVEALAKPEWNSERP